MKKDKKKHNSSQGITRVSSTYRNPNT